MPGVTIRRIEWAPLPASRPRAAGRNARLGEHGRDFTVPVARLTADNGTAGFGWSVLARQQAETLLGLDPWAVFDRHSGIAPAWTAAEYPLLDLLGRLAGEPVYRLVGGAPENGGPPRVPCYDTSLYMDDLHLTDDNEAADLLAGEALEGARRGHTAFKIKIGRGAMHLPLAAGMRRDARIIRAVRAAVGASATIMVDANNGLNLNLTRTLLCEVADARVFWLEEAFHEDPVLYRHLKDWLAAERMTVLIADGEGDASPFLLDWARDGLVDVVQHDIFRPGFSWWLNTGRRLDGWGARSAPHHYGGLYGNYAACHLAGVLRGFQFAEWDEAASSAIDASGYSISGGRVSVPARPGFGLELDGAAFDRAVAERGFRLERGQRC